MTNLTEDDIRKIIDEKIIFSLQDLEKVGRTNYTLSEKISTLIKNTQSKINTDINRNVGEEPNIKKTLFFKDVLKSRIKSFEEIKNFNTVVKINGKKFVTSFIVADLMDGIANYSFENLNLNTVLFLEEGVDLTSVNFNNIGLLSKLPKTVYCFYKYWLNSLTGERAKRLNLTTPTNTSTSGTYPSETIYKNSILTIQDNANNDPNKRYENIINPNNKNFYNLLLDYEPIEIIDNNLVNSFIAENGNLNQLDENYYSNMEQNLLNKIDDTIDIVMGVPTLSTWNNNTTVNNVSSSDYTDNIAFYNPLLERSLNENFGYFPISDGGGYCIKLIKPNSLGINNELNAGTLTTSNTIKESPFVFSSFEGFLLCYGVKNILATLNTADLDINIGNGMPPIISTCRYKGKTLEDGLITAGSNLPDANLSNVNDLFINSSENTLYRLDLSGSTKEWIRVGGSNTFNENVGINNSDPSYNLDVSGDINFTGELYKDGVIFETSRWDICNNSIFRLNTLVGINTDDPIFELDIDGDINFTGELYKNGTILQLNSKWDVSSNFKDIFRMDTKVGINTENPLQALDVSGNINFTGDLYKDGEIFVASRWDLSNNLKDIYKLDTKVGINKIPSRELDVSGDINFSGDLYKDGNLFVTSRWELSGNDIFRMNTNIGINIDNPTKALDISGGMNLTGNFTLTGDITSTSDIRFKENVIQLENCLDKVINLRGVYYNFKNDNTKRIGMIAQEVEEVIPELVVDNVDRKALNYQNMVAILIEAIKELKNKNDYLEQENKNINEKLDYILSKIN
jgi:hypothetical protein